MSPDLTRCEYHPDRRAVAWRRLELLGGDSRAYCETCAGHLASLGVDLSQGPSSAEEAGARRLRSAPVDGGNDE